MDEREFEQLHCLDQVSCNGVLGLVLENSNNEVRIAFDGQPGSAVLSTRDLGLLSDLRVVRKADPVNIGPTVGNRFRRR